MSRFYWSAIFDFEAELTLGARTTYVVLSSYADAEGGCYPSLTALATVFGWTGARSCAGWRS